MNCTHHERWRVAINICAFGPLPVISMPSEGTCQKVKPDA